MPLYTPYVNDPQVVDIAGLTPTANQFIMGNGTNFVMNNLLGSSNTWTESNAFNLPVAGAVTVRGAATDSARLRLFNNGAVTNSILIGQGLFTGTDNIGIIWNTANADLSFGTNNIDRMRIAANGSVTLNSTQTVTDRVTVTSSTVAELRADGPASGTGGGARVSFYNAGTFRNAIGHYSAINGGAYLDVLTYFSSTYHFFQGGLVVGSATGGDKGAGTVNATAVYDDNVLLTDLVLEHAVDGEFDREAYKNHPAVAVIDAHGIFSAERYSDYWISNKHLPHIGTWNDDDDKPSTGELITRLIATVETQAIIIEELRDRLETLEERSAL